MKIVNERMEALGNVRSVIRDLFEYGLQRKKEVGAENVYDYSLGNPSVPAPACVDEAIEDLLQHTDSVQLHGYTSAQGAEDVRQTVAAYVNETFGAGVSAADLYMTCGAAASLTITLHALSTPGDECIAIAPFFPEYRVFAEGAGLKFRVVPADREAFQIDFASLEETVNAHTKALIVNSPNNPSGVVYTRKTLERLCAFLGEKEQEYGHPIYLISDEPYRELVYDGQEVPYLPNLYDDTIVCYSFSKSLSLPGDRIGYILVSPKACEHRAVYAAVAGAGRSLGYVCAPAMMQRVIARCLGKTSDLNVYRENRDLLYNALTSYGYEAVYPDGAFYLFVKTPIDDAGAFAERAKAYDLLLVPSDSFGCGGYVRISYCVSTDMIRRSLPAFEKLISEYR